MINKLNKFINYACVSSILFIILGIVIILYPEITLSIVSYFMAAMGIVFGIALIVMDITNRNSLIPVDTMVSGILLLVFCLILVIYPNTLNILIPIIVGIWFIISGANKLKISILFKNIDALSFFLTIFTSVLSIVCGVVFIFHPIMYSSVITMFSGVIIAIYAISNLVDAICLKTKVKKFKKELNEQIKIIIE